MSQNVSFFAVFFMKLRIRVLILLVQLQSKKTFLFHKQQLMKYLRKQIRKRASRETGTRKHYWDFGTTGRVKTKDGSSLHLPKRRPNIIHQTISFCRSTIFGPKPYHT